MLQTIYSDYEKAGFHLGLQPRGLKAGLGHKPGDYGYYAASAKRAVQWIEHDEGNVSVTAVGDMCYIDLDCSQPIVHARTLMALSAQNAYLHYSPSGGMHILVRCDTDRLYEGTGLITFAGGQIDCKGFGKGYVVGPGSKTPSGSYIGKLGSVLPVVNDVAFGRLVSSLSGTEHCKPTFKSEAPPKYIGEGRVDIAELEYYLSHIPPDMQMREWLAVIYGARSKYGLNGFSNAARHAIIKWCESGHKHVPGEPERIWDTNSASRHRPNHLTGWLTPAVATASRRDSTPSSPR